jgi:pimeloyl-ACP methyl ester carboxylesterase
MSASSEELPGLGEQTAVSSLLREGSVAVDLALRTTLASAVGAVMTAGVARGERKLLEFYAELAEAGDPGAVFGAPPELEVEVAERARAGGVAIETLRFPSNYVALNGSVRDSYAGHRANAVAHARLWRHEDGPRPTLCVVHGFGASPAWFNSRFFSLGRFCAEGWDVLLYTLPFHGARRSTFGPANGLELFAHGVAGLNEGLIHAAQDLRVLLAFLARSGSPRVGVTGLSLGGYLTALLGALEPGLDFVIPNAAVVSMGDLLGSWFRLNLAAALRLRLAGARADLLGRALRIHSPLNYRPLIAKRRMLLIGGAADRLAPPEQSLLLWEHWNRPALHWFPGSHILHFGRGEYLEKMRAMMGPAA